MQVKVTSRTITAAGEHKAGDKIEVDEKTGESLIAGKRAEAVETKKTKAASAKE